MHYCRNPWKWLTAGSKSWDSKPAMRLSLASTSLLSAAVLGAPCTRDGIAPCPAPCCSVTVLNFSPRAGSSSSKARCDLCEQHKSRVSLRHSAPRARGRLPGPGPLNRRAHSWAKMHEDQMLLGPRMHTLCFAKGPTASRVITRDTETFLNRSLHSQRCHKHHLGTMHSCTGLNALPYLKAPRFRVSPFWTPLRAMTQYYSLICL